MPTFFQRPDNALKRANEFIDVGKKHRALDTLYDVIKSKRHRTWQKIHEPIMAKYLELCIELKKSHIAKEGLYQYKNICQLVNIASLDDVVRKYLELAERKTEEARIASHQTVLDIDDLDSIETSEDLLLGGVCADDTQDRNDRTVLTPWVKFLWESYRQCLDLLRNNNSVEKLYQDVAQMAFKFCLKYERKTEFRKLCENLRTHLQQVYKHSNQPRSVNLEKLESQSMHLEVRLVQLDHAINLELWQEAFKAVEDVHGLINLSKKAPKAVLMSTYYQKLALVCWKSGNHLYHASSLHKLFTLSQEHRRNLSGDELQKLASRVVCATLAIPITQNYTNVEQLLQMDEVHLRKQRRLASLISLQVPPTRNSLIKEMSRMNIVNQAYPPVKLLYHTLETDYNPLKLSELVKNQLEFLESKPELMDYVESIQDMSITRLIKQISQAYETITFDRLNRLAPFMNNLSLERTIVQITHKLKLQIRIDHRTQMLTFGSDLTNNSEQIEEGPILQPMPSDTIRSQLTHMASALDKAVSLVNPVDDRRVNIQKHVKTCFISTKQKEHSRILNRKVLIEEKKEQQINETQAKCREEKMKADTERRKQQQVEMSRLEREAERREIQRRRDESEAIQRKAAKDKLDQLRSTEMGARAFQGIDAKEIAEMNSEDILAKQVVQLEKEKKELAEKLRTQEKKVDYFERAKHIEQINLRKAQIPSISAENKKFWDDQQLLKIAKLKEERKFNISCKDKLSRMESEKEIFMDMLEVRRNEVFEDKKTKFQDKLNELRVEKLEERRVLRAKRRRENFIKEYEDNEIKKIDEKKRLAEEEIKRKEMEIKQKEKEEYELKKKKADDLERKRKEKEEEIENKTKKNYQQSERKPFRPANDRDRDSGMNFQRKDITQMSDFSRNNDSPRGDFGKSRNMDQNRRRDDAGPNRPNRGFDNNSSNFRRRDDQKKETELNWLRK